MAAAPPPASIDYDVAHASRFSTENNSSTPTPSIALRAFGNDASFTQGKGASRASIIARTVHLRCLPTGMLQKDLGAIVHGCGAVCRVRVCGNAPTGQNWVYGFVEFTTSAGADRLMKLAGMELDNGAGKPPLRLKCSRAKQPIVDVLPQDADVVKGTPCLFGRDDKAGSSINDVVLVVHKNSTGGPLGRLPNTDAAASSAKVETAATAAQLVCDCGCAEDPTVKCCSCCRCHEGRQRRPKDEKQQGSCCGAGDDSADGLLLPSITSLIQTANASSDNTSNACKTNAPAWQGGLAASAQEALGLGAETRLAALLKRMVARREVLNGDQLVDACRNMLYKGMEEAKSALTRPHPTENGNGGANGPYCSIEGLAKATETFQSAFVLAEQNVAITGDASSCVANDPNSILPQRGTHLRMAALLALALLSLLKRCLSDAVQYLDTLVEIANAVQPTPVVVPAFLQPAKSSWPLSESATSVNEYNVFAGSGSYAGGSGALSGDLLDAAYRLMPLVIEDDEEDSPQQSPTPKENRREGCRQDCGATSSHRSTTALEELQYRRDVHFYSVNLNTLVTVGLALEEVQPQVALNTYALAAEKARALLHMENDILNSFLAAAANPTGGQSRRRLSDAIPLVAAALSDSRFVGPYSTTTTTNSSSSKTRVHDITAFPRAFFLTYSPTDATPEEEASWLARNQPPMHLVRLFPC